MAQATLNSMKLRSCRLWRWELIGAPPAPRTRQYRPAVGREHLAPSSPTMRQAPSCTWQAVQAHLAVRLTGTSARKLPLQRGRLASERSSPSSPKSQSEPHFSPTRRSPVQTREMKRKSANLQADLISEPASELCIVNEREVFSCERGKGVSPRSRGRMSVATGA